VVILVLAALFFAIPLLSAAKFSLQQDSGGTGLGNYGQLFTNPDLRASLFTSLEIALFVVVIDLALMVPTVVFVRLRLPRLSLLLESITVLPIVIPPVVMAAGLASLQSKASGELSTLLFTSPVTALTPFYVILAMPFTFRALDAGLRAIDLRTLVDAARSLGANGIAVLVRVVLPNVRTAVLGAAFLAVALVLGEVVISSILLYTTFPTQIVQTGQSSAGVSVALSVGSLVLTWLLLLGVSALGDRQRRRGHARGRAAARLQPGAAA
jgi:putative spermidine/putrescine transport system permease protein